jgi:hypothetical protein
LCHGSAGFERGEGGGVAYGVAAEGDYGVVTAVFALGADGV